MLKKAIIAVLICAALYAMRDTEVDGGDDVGIVPGVAIPGVM